VEGRRGFYPLIRMIRYNVPGAAPPVGRLLLPVLPVSDRRAALARLVDPAAIVLFDGAMGTELYARGVFINQCYDELCLRSPELIREIHAEYAAAGAEVLETNTFGANRPKLAQYGLEGQVGAAAGSAAPSSTRRAGAGAAATRPASTAPATATGKRERRGIAGLNTPYPFGLWCLRPFAR